MGDQHFVMEGVEGLVGHHDVIQEVDVEEVEGALDAGGLVDVVQARVGVAGGMVVEEDDGVGLALQGVLDDTADVHEGLFFGAHGDAFPADDVLVAVEVEDPALLVVEVLEGREHHAVDGLRVVDAHLFDLRLFPEGAAAQFQGCDPDAPSTDKWQLMERIFKLD